MISSGWIKIHRKLLDNPIMLQPELLQVFIFCLLRANHETHEFIFNNEMVKVERGSFICGRKEMAKSLKRSESSIYRNLKKLQKFEYISLKSNNKFTLLTVIKYNTYQLRENEIEQQVNNKRTTSEQQVNTNKNDKNEKNEEELVEFEKFWNLYNKKRGNKDKIFKQWNSLKHEDKEKIFQTLPLYVKSTSDKQ